ncbi:ribosome biogenesis GTP-binding protein YihA/YsxC, partial [Bacteroidota bacterium]
GKSSLINMLTGRKSLAKISGKPGKTRLINHFLIDKNWYLVDLPGYGYAKVSLEEKLKLNKFIQSYISERMNLACLFVLIDIRHEAQKIDLEFMEKLGYNKIPFVIVFTKSDKLKKSKINGSVENYKKELLKNWEETPQMFISSSITNLGKNKLLKFIDQTNQLLINSY